MRNKHAVVFAAAPELFDALQREHEWRANTQKKNEYDGETGDWACVECHPDSDIIRLGWRCAHHNTRALLAIIEKAMVTRG